LHNDKAQQLIGFMAGGNGVWWWGEERTEISVTPNIQRHTDAPRIISKTSCPGKPDV